MLPCGHLTGMANPLTFVCDVNCDFVTFLFGILGQVWYLIVSISDDCCLSYFQNNSKIQDERYLHEHRNGYS